MLYWFKQSAPLSRKVHQTHLTPSLWLEACITKKYTDDGYGYASTFVASTVTQKFTCH